MTTNKVIDDLFETHVRNRELETVFMDTSKKKRHESGTFYVVAPEHYTPEVGKAVGRALFDKKGAAVRAYLEDEVEDFRIEGVEKANLYAITLKKIGRAERVVESAELLHTYDIKPKL